MQPFKTNNQWIICQDSVKPMIEVDWFEQSFWLNQGRLLGANSGRGTAWVIKSEQGKWVLRHYFRGGLYAKLISKDSYFWTGVDDARAISEFKLLNHMTGLNLPCPKPIAARVIKKGLWYRNDLIMEHIMHDKTFAQYLSQVDDNLAMWHGIGTVIKNFHDQGIFHADLNANNILLAGDVIYLIDFDKGKIKKPQIHWQMANLNRLRRSIEKESGKSCDHELKQHWQALTTSYENS